MADLFISLSATLLGWAVGVWSSPIAWVFVVVLVATRGVFTARGVAALIAVAIVTYVLLPIVYGDVLADVEVIGMAAIAVLSWWAGAAVLQILAWRLVALVTSSPRPDGAGALWEP